MNILNEFIGEFKKDKVFTVVGVGLVLSPSIVIMNLIYTLLLPRMASSDPSGVSADIAYLVFNLIASIIIAPVLEELTYRGLMLIFIKLTHKPVIVLLISSAVFGFMHEGTFGSFQATIAGVILGYIAYEYGLAFSIIFNKQFVVFNNTNGGSERFISLLRVLGLEDRLFEWNADEQIVFQKLREKINYEDVNSRLKTFVSPSLEFLKRSLL